MNSKDLERKLLDIADDFSNEIRALYPAESKEPVTEGDLNELARHVYYSLCEFAKTVSNHLADK